jgi:uncharacterized protein DUF1844
VSEPKHEETFRVIDRRHFTEDGEVRQGAAEQDRREEEAAAAKRSAAQAKPNNAATPAATAPPSAGAAAKDGGLLIQDGEASLEPAAAEPAETAGSSRSFQMLVDFLTRNAAAMLGGMADPRTGQPFVDLEGAREVIDMLDALREKTRGNLAKADDDLLIEVLGSLKLTFMEISKAASEAMAKKAKGQVNAKGK